MLVSTNAPERLPGQVEWSSQAWEVGAIVTRTQTRRVYRAVYDVPAGKAPPEENIAVAQLPYWQDIGPMNQWAAFDKVMKTQTIGPEGDLVLVLQPGATTDLWLGNISGAIAVHAVVKDKPGGAVVYDETRSLLKPVTTYWDWWFADFEFDAEKPFNNIPAYRNSEVTITLTAGSGVASVGMVALGKTENWGCTEWGVNADFQRYTPAQPNQAWGPAQQGGEITKDVTYRVFVEPEDAPRVDRSAKDAMKRLAVYMPSGKPEFAGIRIFGEMINARMGYPTLNYVPFDITVREFL